MNKIQKCRVIGVIVAAMTLHGWLVPVGWAEDANANVRDQVQKEFEVHLDRLRERVDATEEALERIKVELQRREEKADELIAARVAQLLGERATGSKQPGEAAVDAATAPVLSAEGWKAWQKQDYRVALVKFQAAVAKEPQYAAALNGLGWTQFHLNEHEKALATFEKTLKVNPTVSGAVNGIGQCLLALGRFDEAETKLTKATEDLIGQYGEANVVTDGLTASWSGLINVLLKRKKYDEAIQWCERYLQHQPDDVTVTSMLQKAKTAAR